MPGPGLNSPLRLEEPLTGHDGLWHEVQRVLVQRRTPYQELLVVQSRSLGRALVLDGLWQACEADEFLYHEPLVHPACLARALGAGAGPGRVLLLGGGDGGAAREALRWDTVREVVLADIDGAVVDACREHLPGIHKGAFDDPRLRVVVGDAREVVANGRGRWDVIVSDLSDPVEDGPAVQLFTREFFAACNRALRPGGVFATQAGMTFPPDLALHARLARTVSESFAHAAPYASTVPLWGGAMGFVLASEAPLPDFTGALEARRVDELLAARLRGPLRALDGAALKGLFALPLHVRRAHAQAGPAFTARDAPGMARP